MAPDSTAQDHLHAPVIARQLAPPRRGARAALDWLASHGLEQPSLDEAARAMGMSAFRFQRLFSRWAGVSPKQCLQARMEALRAG